MNRLLSLYGRYWPWDRFVYVYTAPYPAHSLLGAWPMHFLPTLAPTAELVRQLEQLRPTLLACYPSHLRALAEELGPERCKALALRAISVSSEASSARERAELGAMFGCGVYDEYSTEELTRIAAQCRFGAYHLFEDVAYIETLDEAGQSTAGVGEVVGTYLHNFAMPFIRYRQGDLARVSVGGGCRCGYQFRSLSELVGRKLASFTLPSGRVLSSGFLLDASYSFLLDIGADLAGFTITQETLDRVLIELLPGKSYRAESSEQVKRRFLELVAEPISVEVQLVTSLRRGPAGKHNPIVSKLHSSSGSNKPG
jgi:phenylacetate-CoA ligase